MSVRTLICVGNVRGDLANHTGMADGQCGDLHVARHAGAIIVQWSSERTGVASAKYYSSIISHKHTDLPGGCGCSDLAKHTGEQVLCVLM